jgi:hypothetical protein
MPAHGSVSCAFIRTSPSGFTSTWTWSGHPAAIAGPRRYSHVSRVCPTTQCRSWPAAQSPGRTTPCPARPPSPPSCQRESQHRAGHPLRARGTRGRTHSVKAMEADNGRVVFPRHQLSTAGRAGRSSTLRVLPARTGCGRLLQGGISAGCRETGGRLRLNSQQNMLFAGSLRERRDSNPRPPA